MVKHSDGAAGNDPSKRKTIILRRTILWAAVSLASAGAMTVPSVAVAGASPASPGTSGTAAPNAQCGTSAESGAFNAHNALYGPNSRAFGQAGGAGGGQVGLNNSAICGNR